jgi:hypothetical protein
MRGSPRSLIGRASRVPSEHRRGVRGRRAGRQVHAGDARRLGSQDPGRWPLYVPPGWTAYTTLDQLAWGYGYPAFPHRHAGHRDWLFIDASTGQMIVATLNHGVGGRPPVDSH